MNKNQKNKKILFTLLLTLTFVVGLIPLSIRGANADELTQPLEQMVISTTGEQLNEGDVSEPNEIESSEKDNQELEVENSEVPEKEALEPTETEDEEKPDELNSPLVVDEETPHEMEKEPGEETSLDKETAEKDNQEIEVETSESSEKEALEPNATKQEEKSDEVNTSIVEDEETPQEVENVPSDETQKVPLAGVMLNPEKNLETTSKDSSIKPGEVKVDKFAKPVKDLVNTWDITLRIEAADTAKSSDIVLVIDTSGSMGQRSRIENAKVAATQFVTNLKGKSNTRIALITYSTDVTIHTGFVDMKNGDTKALTDAIDGLSADGGTFTQAGIKNAQVLLEQSNADFKNIVLLSDGEPTYSYAIKNNYLNQSNTFEWTGEWWNGRYQTKKDISSEKFNYGLRVGSGRDLYSKISGNYWYNHGNSAISQAKIFKDSDDKHKIWTIALETDQSGTSILKQIASPGKDFTSDASGLAQIFQQIAGNISSAAKDLKIIDHMGEGFEITETSLSNITRNQGDFEYVKSDNDKNILIWNVGKILENSLANNSNVKYAEMTYRVSITDEILDIKPVPSDGLYPTNGNAELLYKDESDSDQTIKIESPYVNPIFLKVEKVLLDADGNEIEGDPQEFSINVHSSDSTKLPDSDYNEYDNEFTLIPGDGKPSETTTDLRLADTYTVSEMLRDGDISDYEVTITVNDVETNTFEVNGPSEGPSGTPQNDSGQDDIKVKVTNKEKKLGELKLEKVLLDPNGTEIKNDKTPFTFIIIGPDGSSRTEIVTVDEHVTIKDLKYGEYTVEETPTTGYTEISESDDKKVKLDRKNKEGKVTITNKQSTTNVVVSKVVDGNMGNRDKEFSFTASLENGVKFPRLGTGYKIDTNNPSKATFELKHGGKEVTLIVPIGASLTIEETDSDGHDVVIKVGMNGPEIKSRNYTIKELDKETTITFTNTKNAVIDTGIALDSLPYLLILFLLAIGGVGRLIWIRNQRELD